MNLTLYEIEDALAQLAEAREQAEHEGDAIQVAKIDDALEHYLSREAKKIDSYANLLKQMGDEVTLCRMEAARLHDRACAIENRRDAMKQNAMAVMNRFGVRSLKSARNTLRIQANGGLQAMDIYNPTGLPPEFMQWTLVPKQTEIRIALERGEEIPGARLLPRGEHLRVE